MPPKVRKCHFQNQCLMNEEYSNWVQAVSKNRSRVKCLFCKTEIDISNMGVAALDSHASRPEQKRAFKRECKQLIIVFIQKLQERCPLKYSIVRNSSALSPDLVVEEKELSKMKFQGLVERLCKPKWVNVDEADDGK